jgi:hypothetical protein
MSRAFVREDDEDRTPKVQFTLPPREHPTFDAAAALALLEGAHAGVTDQAEQATGYRWGDAQLHSHVRRLLEKEQALPEESQDRRLIQVAKRFLTAQS